MGRRKNGFTLIELLVVIAIIAILAAMLFPVFARARESARKIQCLSNIKNIALAYQMYLTDYDRFPPAEHDPLVLQTLLSWGGGTCWIKDEDNPYLRDPVILDEYVRNRDVWNCPSGPAGVDFGINWCIPDWWTYAVGKGKCSRMVCMNPFPAGWGGDVTDTILQQRCAGGGRGTGAFELNYATVRLNRDVKTGAMDDPTKWVVVGDCSGNVERWHTYSFAYEGCRIACEGVNCAVCESGWGCVGYPYTENQTTYRTDVNARKTTQGVRARHLGGNNLGFADGHAAWYDSEAILWGGRQPTRAEMDGENGRQNGPFMPAGDKFQNLLGCRFPPVSEYP
jgi:prepilin-type N-terminal cleavage/methylation domain-containing protein/prepilin-type processing-associated H-X9-DG protein